MRTLTMVAWVIDGLILLYFIQLLAGKSSEWSGAGTILLLMVLLAGAIAGSAALFQKPNRGARLAALAIAGALPLVGGLMFLGVLLIALVAMLTGARWN